MTIGVREPCFPNAYEPMRARRISSQGTCPYKQSLLTFWFWCYTPPSLSTGIKEITNDSEDCLSPLVVPRADLRPPVRTCIGILADHIDGRDSVSTNSSGAASGGQIWNTLGGDSYYDLWLALNPDATSPVNGPADTQAGIAFPLEPGQSYTYSIFGQPNVDFSCNGLNLFFDGNNATPASRCSAQSTAPVSCLTGAAAP